jgi:hypothetical protein
MQPHQGKFLVLSENTGEGPELNRPFSQTKNLIWSDHGGKMDSFINLGTRSGEEMEKLQSRLTNYNIELEALKKKLNKNQVPNGKKDKLIFRFNDIQEGSCLCCNRNYGTVLWPSDRNNYVKQEMLIGLSNQSTGKEGMMIKRNRQSKHDDIVVKDPEKNIQKERFIRLKVETINELREEEIDDVMQKILDLK